MTSYRPSTAAFLGSALLFTAVLWSCSSEGPTGGGGGPRDVLRLQVNLEAVDSIDLGSSREAVFTAERSTRYRISLQALDGDGTGTLSLAALDSADNLLASGSAVPAAGGLHDAMIELPSHPTARTVRLLVTRGATSGTDRFRILVRSPNGEPEHAAADIAVGDTIVEGFDGGFDSDRFRFTANAGDELLLYFSLPEFGSSPRMSIVLSSPAIGQIFSAPIGGFTQLGQSVYSILPTHDGVLELVVREVSGFLTGGPIVTPYAFTITKVNRAPETAPASLAVGDTIREAIDHHGDIDEFLFTVEPGTQVLFNWRLVGGSPREVTATFGDGESGISGASYPMRRIAEDLDSDGTGAATFTEPGPHLVRFSSVKTGSTAVATGEYEFELFRVDSAPEAAPATVPLYSTVSGAFERRGDVDAYTIPLAGGQYVGFHAKATLPNADQDLEISLCTTPTDCEGLIGTTLSGSTQPISGYLGLHYVHEPTDYTLLVWGILDGQVSYEITSVAVDSLPEHVPPSLVSGQWVVGEDLESELDIDFFTLDVLPSERWVFHLGSVPGVNRQFRLSAAGQAFIDDSVGSTLWQTFPSAGTKRIAVSGFGDTVPTGEPTGYRIQAYRLNTAPETASATLAVGDTVRSESLDAKGDEDHFALALSAGQSIRVCLDETDLSLPPDRLSIDIWTPTDMLMQSVETLFTRRACADYTADATGSHRIVVRGFSPRQQVSDQVPYALAITPR